MSIFIAEFIGTAILLLFGNGVVANVLLQKSKGHNGGLISIAMGWAMGVFLGVVVAGKFSGGHLNPVVTLSMAYLGKMPWNLVPTYVVAQLLGAMAGTTLVWLCYRQQYAATKDPDAILATFCTAPAVPNFWQNVLTEAIATFALMVGVLFLAAPGSDIGSVSALPVALVVLATGLSLGGPTGYAVNPVRDLGPRIMHQLLPIAAKGHSHWGYAAVPLLGPLLGGLLATALFHFTHLP
ncbi:MAG: aquaporin family protein [Bacteroidetes bacterium]|nr:MAG: aquaporin family protein [Bacteroidota bacterium]